MKTSLTEGDRKALSAYRIEQADGYILIFECRQRNDYDTFIEVDREEIDGLYQKGRAFVNCVIDILNVRDVQPGNL